MVRKKGCISRLNSGKVKKPRHHQGWTGYCELGQQLMKEVKEKEKRTWSQNQHPFLWMYQVTKDGILMFLCLGGPGLLNSPLAQQLLYAVSHIKHCSILRTMSSFLQMQRLIIIQHETASNLAKLNCITAKWQISGSFIAMGSAVFPFPAPTFAGKSGVLLLWKQPGGQLICLLGLNASMEVK